MFQSQTTWMELDIWVRELGVPVTSSNHCTLWAALTHMKVATSGLGLGKLFELPVSRQNRQAA